MKKITYGFLFLTLLAIASHVSADFSLSDWKFKKLVEIPSLTNTSYIKVKIDPELWKESGSSFQDVRIIDGSQNEVPYQIVTKQATSLSEYYPVQMYDTSVVGGKTVFVLDLGEGTALHNELHIDTASHNFKRQVSVYAADTSLALSSQSWRLLTDKGYIYNFNDSTANFNAGSGDVSYPKTTSRFLKAVIDVGAEGPISVTTASVYKNVMTPEEDDTTSVGIEITQNPKEKSTELLIDKTIAGVPSHSLSISSGDVNFSRRVVVQASTDKTSWRIINQGYIFSIKTSLFTGSQMTLDFPETADRYLRVIVFNDDNKPVHFDTTATVKSVIRNLVFQASEASVYSIYYGNPTAHTPHYDLDRIFPYVETEVLPEGTLGEQQSNEQYTLPPPPAKPLSEKVSYLADTAVVLLSILIGLLIYSYLRKIQSKI